ncbi:phage portal protein [Qipengyuania sp. DSG2-2]|uniref:phage portal protein n=1 Tax=Qipengyuania sp. DGS2-2 TaxID=3349631 RepID=UPI0036D3AC6A
MSFLDTLSSAFKGGGGARVPLNRAIPSGYVSPWATAFEAGTGRAAFNYNSALQSGFIDNPVAQRAVRIVAEGVGSAPLGETDTKLAALINAPSAGQSLIETLAAHLTLHGNGYVQIMKDAGGKPVELFALRPERVSVVAGPDGWPCAYEYRLAERTITVPLEDDNGWPEIIHLRSFNPGDDHYGAGCLAAAHGAVAIHNAASEWNRALLANSARPSGALVHDASEGASLTPEQFERLKDELTRAFSGEANVGRPMLLDGGLSWQSMAMSPAEMDFATLKAAAARDIALAFGVPPMLLGLPGDNTYANYREANRALWRLTLLPLAGKILSGIADGLSPWFPDASLSVDLDRVPALADDREKLWSQVTAADFLSDEEKRVMLGLDTGAAQ